MKNETTLSVLKEIRDILKNNVPVVPIVAQEQGSWAKITDTPDKKTSEILNECKALFFVWSYYKDEELDLLCPPPKETITKIFKESIEPDLLNKSYNNGITEKINFMSARERIILELQYFKKTGKRLDIKGWTITSTLDSGGRAMRMGGDGNGEFHVRGGSRGNRDDSSGLRQHQWIDTPDKIKGFNFAIECIIKNILKKRV